jgi:hypothetical protein
MEPTLILNKRQTKHQVSDKQGNEFIHLESKAFSEEDELDLRS